LQYLYVVGFAAPLAAVTELVMRRGEQRQALRERFNATLDELRHRTDLAYTEVKKIRRLARLQLPDRLVGEELDRMQKALMAQQFEFEAAHEDASDLERYLPRRALSAFTRLKTALKGLDSYLSNIWGEYELAFRERRTPTASSGAIRGFLLEHDDPGATFDQFKCDYNTARAATLELKARRRYSGLTALASPRRRESP
jgi:hypothetical protein